MSIKNHIPLPVRKGAYWLTRPIREFLLGRELSKLSQSRSSLDWVTADRLSASLRSHFVADAEYLLAVAEEAEKATGPILECGSGLTTIVAAIYSEQPVYCLEQHRPSRRLTAKLAVAAGVAEQVHIVPTDLVDYGDFEWYSFPPTLPSSFALVLADGPPGATTRGGRVGLMPVVADRLAAGATVILDDASRPDELAAAAEWTSGYGLQRLPSGSKDVGLFQLE